MPATTVEAGRRREAAALAALVLATVALRCIRLDQPIVENYVGRQVPTAMVARNLDRGSGFLRPQLDTGPFPNLFLVEPPVYAEAVVGGRRLTGLAIGPAGRLVSALATGLGAWGLFGLVRRRERAAVALGAVATFALMPVMIRYGRAVQPDALMLGTQLAALRCWDAYAAGWGRWRLAVGWALLATSLALKVTTAPVTLPLVWLLLGGRRWRAIGLSVLAILPALAWYAHAAALLAEGDGSRASIDNGRIWLGALVPTALLEPSTYGPAARFLLVRAYTPIGVALGLVGLFRRPVDRLWPAWAGFALLTLAALAAKWHHEYYWMLLAPPVAVGVARSLDRLAGWSRPAAAGLGAFAAAAALALSASTWRTPAEWSGLVEAGRTVAERVPPDGLVVASEALLYAADRRGCRLELPPPAARRAAGEWASPPPSLDGPLALVEFYRNRGATHLAVLRPDSDAGTDPDRDALIAAARRRHRVVVDRDGLLLVALTPAPPEAPDDPDRTESDPASGPRRRPGDAARPAPLEGGGPQDRRADRL